jgi:hypothetical protein
MRRQAHPYLRNRFIVFFVDIQSSLPLKSLATTQSAGEGRGFKYRRIYLETRAKVLERAAEYHFRAPK